jgi:uncharacterized protein YdeI (YjbR/CyaY-like superfamily)
MTPTFFAKQADWRNWLEENHKNETEFLVGFYKVDCENQSMTWSQSVDEALCFGWIDGIRKSIDKNSYQIRFTQRKSGSIWSAVNIKKVEQLIQQGLMKPSGLVSFEKRTESKSKIYAYENEGIKLSPDFEERFKANKIASEYFQSIAASYQKLSTHWVMSAKQEATKLKRLNELIADSELLTNKWKDNKYHKK